MVRMVAVDHRIGNHGIHGRAATVSVSDRAGDLSDLYRLDADTSATRNQHPLYFNLAGLLLWPFGWVISGLGTQFFVDLAINATNQQPDALYAVGGLAIWIVLAIWTISSAIAAPLIISKLLNTSTAGVIVMLGQL